MASFYAPMNPPSTPPTLPSSSSAIPTPILTTISTSATAVPAPPPPSASTLPYPPSTTAPSITLSHQIPPSSFTFASTMPSAAPLPHQIPTSSSTPAAAKPLFHQFAITLSNSTPNTHAPYSFLSQNTISTSTPSSTFSSPRLPGRPYARHAWTAAEVDLLCCLRIHTDLQYEDISLKIHQRLGGMWIRAEHVRYKCNVLSNTVKPSQRARRATAMDVDARWSHYSNLSSKSLEVQRVLRACSLTDLWFGQLEEDRLAVLLQYGELLDAEVARRLSVRFDYEVEEEMVRWWYERNVGSADGSWGWFDGRADGDAEVAAVLGEFRL
ncbi:hypothetical protein MMC08_003873 [Hypocenomyce scalaris]|nr:hypothetical protein [Hypocenomyce scalaris]